MPNLKPHINTEIKSDYSIGRFTAMACPCEILLDSKNQSLIEKVSQLAYQEAKRIEKKFSRYRNDNIIYKINNANGQPIEVDAETALMFDFADQCFELSEGKFDITSGILRKIWTFDGSDHIPSKQQIEELKAYIGWNKVRWNKGNNRQHIVLPAHMEIDLGGIGKEYAVDSTVTIIKQQTDESFLVNYGGDISCPKPRKNKQPWMIGIDDPKNTGESAIGQISLLQGGMATSGDARRFLLKDNIRYSHILDPHSGYPVPNAPRSVTVIANTCIEAGMLSTFAMLQGEQAADFLDQQDVKYWCIP